MKAKRKKKKISRAKACDKLRAKQVAIWVRFKRSWRSGSARKSKALERAFERAEDAANEVCWGRKPLRGW